MTAKEKARYTAALSALASSNDPGLSEIATKALNAAWTLSLIARCSDQSASGIMDALKLATGQDLRETYERAIYDNPEEALADAMAGGWITLHGAWLACWEDCPDCWILGDLEALASAE